jgi:hypothetical protein
MIQPSPAAFMSYARFDDQHERGHISALRDKLSAEVRANTGTDFPIFLDHDNIDWGQNWKQRIEESLDAVTFLIPVVTPSFFKSEHCRAEVERFVEREQQLGRNDLILPIYYRNHEALNDRTQAATDRIVELIKHHQYVDWRDLRLTPLDDPIVRRMLDRMAQHIVRALARISTPSPPSPQTPRQQAASTLRDAAQRIKVGGDTMSGAITTGNVSGSGIAIGHGAQAQSRGGEAAGTQGGEAQKNLPVGSRLRVQATLKHTRQRLEQLRQTSTSTQSAILDELLGLLSDMGDALQRVPRNQAQQAEALATSIADVIDVIQAVASDSPNLIVHSTERLEHAVTELSVKHPEIEIIAENIVMEIAELLREH